jgi:hypothetical protein
MDLWWGTFDRSNPGLNIPWILPPRCSAGLCNGWTMPRTSYAHCHGVGDSTCASITATTSDQTMMPMSVGRQARFDGSFGDTYGAGDVSILGDWDGTSRRRATYARRHWTVGHCYQDDQRYRGFLRAAHVSATSGTLLVLRSEQRNRYRTTGFCWLLEIAPRRHVSASVYSLYAAHCYQRLRTTVSSAAGWFCASPTGYQRPRWWEASALLRRLTGGCTPHGAVGRFSYSSSQVLIGGSICHRCSAGCGGDSEGVVEGWVRRL